MTAPPFAIPAGMDWDPIKKRFFKRLPEKAKVEPRQSLYSQQSHREAEARFAQRTPLPRSAFASSSSTPLGYKARLVADAAFRTSPSYSSIQRRKYAVIEANLGQLQHVSTTSLNPSGFRETGPTEHSKRWDVSIKSLHHTSPMGSLLCFGNGSGDLFFLDTWPSSRHERCSPLSVLLAMRTTPDADSGEISPSELVDLKSLSNVLLHMDNRFSLYSIHEEHFAIFHDNSIIVGVLEKSGSRLLRGTANSLLQMKATTEQVQHLCMRGLQNESGSSSQEPITLAYATQRRLYIVQLQYNSVTTMEAASQALSSDIICLEMSPLGEKLFVGLRNGTIVEYDTGSFLREHKESEAGVEAGAPSAQRGKKLKPKRSSRQHHTALGMGAVTHIKSLSHEEMVVAYSSGELYLVHPRALSEPLVRYHGHVNSWSLDLPMTIDAEHRLLAVAGQDRKVRIWSLDHPLPLHHEQSNHVNSAKEAQLDLADGQLSTRPLQETTFASPISGLAFCQRRYITNLRHHSMSRGLPALAVSCHGNEIAFFE